MAFEAISRGAVLAALAAAALAACKSGGSDGSAPPPPPVQPATWLLYKDGSPGGLVALDPAALSTATVEPSGLATVASAALVTVGTWSGARARLEAVHSHAVVYWKRDLGTDEDQLWAADVAGATAPSPRRLSTLSLPPGAVCTRLVFPDHALPSASAVVVVTGGADADCATATDNTLALARLSAGPATAPATYAGAAPAVIAAVPSAAGGIHAWIMRRDASSGVWLEPADWAAPATTTLAAGAVGFVASYPGRVWLAVDGSLKAYAAGASALADPGGVPTTIPASRLQAVDERDLYWVEAAATGAPISRVRLDGGAAAQVVHGLQGEAAAALTVTEDRIVYRNLAGAWRAVPKAGGDPITLWTQPPTDTVRVHTAGRSLWFYDTTRRGSTSVDPAGATSTHGTYDAGGGGVWAYWGPVAGASMRFGTTPYENPARVLLVEADRVTGDVRLRSFDAATAVESGGATSFPPDLAVTSVMPPLVAAESSGSTGAVLIAAFDAANRGEVLVVKAADPGTLHRVTATGALGEAPVGALTGSCSTGGGLTASGLVVALALRRLRRRRS